MNTCPKIIIDPLYAPCLSYWALLIDAKEVLVEARSFYRKGSFRNRCHIYGANGLLRLSVPLQHGKDQRRRMDEVWISYDHPWQSLHWDSICIAYRSSPYFEYYETGLERFYRERFDRLIDFDLELAAHIAGLIGLEWTASMTVEYRDDYPMDWADLREMMHPDPARGIRGRAVSKPYRQVFGPKHGFIPDLSILDLLFHAGPASLEYLKHGIGVDLPPVRG